MELGILITFMVVTIVLMLGMMWVFKDWLKQRSSLIESDRDED